MRKMFCTLALLALATPLLASDPFAGTWVSNAAKTKYTAGAPPKNVTIVIQEQGTDLIVTATGSAGDGSPVAVKYTVPVKGGAGTVEQGDFDAITAKQESDRVRENTYMKDGKQLRTRRMIVSKDGKTMTSEVNGAGPDGKPSKGVDFYDRQ